MCYWLRLLCSIVLLLFADSGVKQPAEVATGLRSYLNGIYHKGPTYYQVLKPFNRSHTRYIILKRLQSTSPTSNVSNRIYHKSPRYWKFNATSYKHGVRKEVDRVSSNSMYNPFNSNYNQTYNKLKPYSRDKLNRTYFVSPMHKSNQISYRYPVFTKSNRLFYANPMYSKVDKIHFPLPLLYTKLYRNYLAILNKLIRYKSNRFYYPIASDELTRRFYPPNYILSGMQYRSKNKKSNTLFRILCFGDSLTEGYAGRDYPNHPYSINLQKMLSKYYGHLFSVVTRGIGGETVHYSMITRLQRELNMERYDLVIVLGGINDMVNLDVIDKTDLYKDIELLHNVAYSHDIKTVAMTLLEAYPKVRKLKFLTSKEFVEVREYVNEFIRHFSSNKTLVCDIARLFPFDSLPSSLKKKYWSDDQVHLTPNGYDKLGETIFYCLQRTLDNLVSRLKQTKISNGRQIYL